MDRWMDGREERRGEEESMREIRAVITEKTSSSIRCILGQRLNRFRNEEPLHRSRLLTLPPKPKATLLRDLSVLTKMCPMARQRRARVHVGHKGRR